MVGTTLPAVLSVRNAKSRHFSMDSVYTLRSNSPHAGSVLGFCRAPTTKYASERAYTKSLTGGFLWSWAKKDHAFKKGASPKKGPSEITEKKEKSAGYKRRGVPRQGYI